MDEYGPSDILRVISTLQTSNPKRIGVFSFDFFMRKFGEKSIDGRGAVTSARYHLRRVYIGTNSGKFFIVSFSPSHASPSVFANMNIPGVPRYIHILDQNLIFTFGKGFGNFGIKIWLFDVSNIAFPK